MKRIFSTIVFTLVCSLFLPSKCSAQFFQNHFNIYRTDSVTSDGTVNGTTVFQTVTIDGYTQVSTMPPIVFHTPHIRNQIGSSGGWYTGSSVCPGCYISYSNTQGAQPGNLLEDDNAGAEVVCSLAGIFFYSFEFFQLEVAYTRSLNTGVLRGTAKCPNGQDTCNIWFIVSYCTPPTSPPDWNPSSYGIQNTYPATSVWYIDGITACVRIKGTGQAGWVCLPSGASLSWPQSLNLSPANCTHTP